ncbi:transposase [Cohnella sp. NL03-T5]|nr:transposase [Cohnella silvisoli]
MFPDHLTFEAFCQQFNSEQACAEALFEARWPDGFRCPTCRHPHFYPNAQTASLRMLLLSPSDVCHRRHHHGRQLHFVDPMVPSDVSHLPAFRHQRLPPVPSDSGHL